MFKKKDDEYAKIGDNHLEGGAGINGSDNDNDSVEMD